MSLIIKGIEMPKNKNVSIVINFGGTVSICAIMEDGEHMIPSSAKAIPLPEKHGRIVDAAEVIEKANNSAWFDGDVAELGLLLGSEVTTIIPAEGGGEDG